MLNFLSTGQLKLKCCDPKILIINLLISRTELNFMALVLMNLGGHLHFIVLVLVRLSAGLAVNDKKGLYEIIK